MGLHNNFPRGLVSVTRPWIFQIMIFLLLTACTLSPDTPSTADRQLEPLPEQSPQMPTTVLTPSRNLEPAVAAGTPTKNIRTSEPLQQKELEPTLTILPSQSPTITATPSVTVVAATDSEFSPFLPSELDRFGITISRFNSDAEAAHSLGLPFGSTLNWHVMIKPPEVPAEFWQLVRVNEEGIRSTSWDIINQVLGAYPGSYWIVGNEPDVKWQDNVTPQRYAEIYHEVYSFIKERDPEARVVIGGVAQPTPLRRAYLDKVLDAYAATYGGPMPVDVWNVHAFILREEEDSWGVGIPPGLAGEEGILYEIEDHDDIEIFAQNIRDFRRWMNDRGYGDKPLVVSEYGILMPEDYGFPTERVSTFMEDTLNLFREMKGEDGYAEDGSRLVQWWFWYSLYDGLLYSTGNLWDGETGQLTELGRTWSRYITGRGIDINPAAR
jgi:hypothetical protein